MRHFLGWSDCVSFLAIQRPSGTSRKLAFAISDSPHAAFLDFLILFLNLRIDGWDDGKWFFKYMVIIRKGWYLWEEQLRKLQENRQGKKT